jgi:hypothetical protein
MGQKNKRDIIMKKIWITSLAHEEKHVQRIMAMLKTYALDANGHFWMDDLKKMAC